MKRTRCARQLASRLRRQRVHGRSDSEKNYRIIVETASEGVWTLDARERTSFVNHALCEMFGYEPREMLGRTVFDFMAPADRADARRRLALGREGVDEHLEVRFLAKDGREVWTLLATSLLYASDGAYAGALAMVADITARKAAEAERAHLAAIVESSGDSIIGATTDGVIRSWNAASTRLYGYSVDEALGQHVPTLLAREPSEREQFMRRAAGGEEQPQYEVQDLSKDGRVIDVSVSASPIRDSQGQVIGLSRIARDISQRKRMERELRYLAEHDWLTGLYNRRHLIPEIDRCLAHTRRYRRAGAMLVLDVDNFKLINDTKGHDAGDIALKSVASVLSERARETDVVARLGGDEFAVVLPEASGDDALKFATDIRLRLREVRVGSPISVSIGISVFEPTQEIAPADVLASADGAQYEAKESGGDQARIFKVGSASALTWVDRIRRALDEQRFVLFCQPIVDLDSGLTVRKELLIRMRSGDGEIILPSNFLPTAEHFGLIGEIDRWVTQQGLELALGGERVAINLSGPSIGDRQILGLVKQAIADGLDPANVVFEITETAAISHFARAELFVDELHSIGCEIALDDFGTGFGSFTYLRHLKAGYLKIDVQFVRDLMADETDRKVVMAIVDIAHSLGKKTIAEGVEDAATLTVLKDLGVDLAQGFHVGRPSSLASSNETAEASRDAPSPVHTLTAS